MLPDSPEQPESLWGTLEVGSHIHTDQSSRPGWSTVERWLTGDHRRLTSATNQRALAALAAHGNTKGSPIGPLRDDQTVALRDALDEATEADQLTWGPGIGRAVLLNATTYDKHRNVVATEARPAAAYIIENDKDAWVAAARQTPGPVWLDRRYQRLLRTSDHTNLGAQKLFRLLGAETSPRLLPHPQMTQRFANHEPGLAVRVSDPPRRRDQMNRLGASYTLNEQISPDLEAVVADIARDRNRQSRSKRAHALLSTLHRHWHKLDPFSRVDAVDDYYQWGRKGTVPAWWVFQASGVAWLSDRRGRPATPASLRLPTEANQAMHGPDARYLAAELDTPAFRLVLSALGVEGDPTIPELLDRLAQIRDDHPVADQQRSETHQEHLWAPGDVADVATPIYAAIADVLRIPGAKLTRGDRQRFDLGSGLIITDLGWRPPSQVSSGPPIFGDLAPFVPAIRGAEPLWQALGIHPPNTADARSALGALPHGTLNPNQQLIMLNALRILAAAPTHDQEGMKKLPVYVGNKSVMQRPVYAIDNPILAQALSGSIKVWHPGTPIEQLAPLITPLGLTRLDATTAQVLDLGRASLAPDLTAVFAAAVRLLQVDLTRADPDAEQSLAIDWGDLTQFSVLIHPQLAIAIPDPRNATTHQVSVDAWLDPTEGHLLISSSDELARAATGGYAVASAFLAPGRAIANAWAAACAEALVGRDATPVLSAASEQTEQANRRARESLADLAGAAQGRSSTVRASGTSTDKATSRNVQPADRLLIDSTALTVRPSGISERTNSSGNTRPPRRGSSLRDPVSRPSSGSSLGKGVTNYTGQQRERAGLDLLRLALNLDESALRDIRDQPGVGADAMDDEGRYYELKVHAGQIPDQVQLQGSELQRALTTSDFYLVLVGNVERGHGDPELRIIADPLRQLRLRRSNILHLDGIHAAEALTYHFDHATGS